MNNKDTNLFTMYISFYPGAICEYIGEDKVMLI